MRWRLRSASFRDAGKDGRVAALADRVERDEPVGVLAYADGEAVGWCSIAPRDSYAAVLALRRDDRDEQRPVRHVESNAQRPGRERDQVQLGQRQRVQRVTNGDGGEQRGPSQVGGDHRQPAPSVPVGEGPDRQPEQQAGQPLERGQVPHLGRGRVQREHRRQRQRDPGDLIPEHRDRRGTPVPPEHSVPQ